MFSHPSISLDSLKVFSSPTMSESMVCVGEAGISPSPLYCGNGCCRENWPKLFCPFPFHSNYFLHFLSLVHFLSLTFYLPWLQGAQPVVCFSSHSAWHVHICLSPTSSPTSTCLRLFPSATHKLLTQVHIMSTTCLSPSSFHLLSPSMC